MKKRSCAEKQLDSAHVLPLQLSLTGSSGNLGPKNKNIQIRAVGELVLKRLCGNTRRCDYASRA